MSVFICWSGTRSKLLAAAVRELLNTSLPASDGAPAGTQPVTFLSEDIDKGAAWFDRIMVELQSASAGIVCLTPESLKSPWLHFEAGALACRLQQTASHDRRSDGSSPAPDPRRPGLFTLLHGVTSAALRGPLSAYQATTTSRQDMTALVSSLARTLSDQPGARDRGSIPAIPDAVWMAFEAKLERIALPVRHLIPRFDSLFQRKTFNEPLQNCADQAWLARHEGARLTRERLAAYRGRVRRAAVAHERDVFDLLLAEVDGYAMSLKSLLLRSRRFRLGANGTLELDDGIRNCCEDRRLAIRSLASRLARPLDSPAAAEAVRFMGAETDEERKMIVHRLESEIRRQWEITAGPEANPQSRKSAIGQLTTPRPAVPGKENEDSDHEHVHPLTRSCKPLELRASSWDLDRIYYYLLVRYFDYAVTEANGQDLNDVVCAARDVEMEVERFAAKSKGGSLMPLTYALIAMYTLQSKTRANAASTVPAVERAVSLLRVHLANGLADTDAALWLEQMYPSKKAENGASDDGSAAVDRGSAVEAEQGSH